MFVPTDDLELIHARAERAATIEELVRVVDAADGWVSAEAIAAEMDGATAFVRSLAVEQTETWLLQRETATGGYEFTTPEGWVVEGWESDRLHTDRSCQHLDTFPHRPATDEECDLVEECAECGDEEYRADEQDWSAYQAAREAGADD